MWQQNLVSRGFTVDSSTRFRDNHGSQKKQRHCRSVHVLRLIQDSELFTLYAPLRGVPYQWTDKETDIFKKKNTLGFNFFWKLIQCLARVCELEQIFFRHMQAFVIKSTVSSARWADCARVIPSSGRISTCCSPPLRRVAESQYMQCHPPYLLSNVAAANVAASVAESQSAMQPPLPALKCWDLQPNQPAIIRYISSTMSWKSFLRSSISSTDERLTIKVSLKSPKFEFCSSLFTTGVFG